MACNLTNEQSKKFFEDPVRRAALWDAAIDKYIKNGADFVETVNGLAGETGIPKQAVMDVLRPKTLGKELTNDMWFRQYARRQIGESVKRVAASTGKNVFQRAYGAFDSLTRRVTTFGHFTVFGKTHMGDSLWTNPVEYLKNFKNTAPLFTKSGMAAHELRMQDMFLDNDYNLAVRSKLDVTARNEASQILGGGTSKLSHAAFEELQLRRFEAFKKAIRSLPPEERTVQNTTGIAELINNRTGGGSPGRLGGFVGKFLFGPRLTPAQWRAAFGDNVRAVYNGILNRGSATPGELVAARMTAARMAKLLTIYGGALGLEAAAAKMGWIDKRNMPNFTNPKDTGSYMRLKFFGKGVPLSPTIELLALPVKMIYSAYAGKPGENALVNFATPLVKYLGFRLSPGLSLAASLGIGQEIFSGRPMPWHQTQLTKKGQPVLSELTHPKLTYTEFLGERLPIPAAVFLRDVYDEMRADGVDHPTAKALISGAVAAATTGATGYEWHPDVPTPYKQAEAQTPENASDQQRARILNRAMQDFRRQRKGQPTPKEAFGIGQ